MGEMTDSKTMPEKLERHEAIAELKDIIRRMERKKERIERVIAYLEDEEQDEMLENEKNKGGI